MSDPATEPSLLVKTVRAKEKATAADNRLHPKIRQLVIDSARRVARRRLRFLVEAGTITPAQAESLLRKLAANPRDAEDQHEEEGQDGR